MRARRWCLVVFCLLLSASLSAQKYTPKKITFSGYDRGTQADLLMASGLKPDTALGQEEMNAAALQLSKTGLFSDVHFAFNGVELHFVLKPADGMLPVAYENFPWWDSKTLTASLEQKVPLFQGSVVPESGLQAQVIASLTALLAEKGVQATVTPAPKIDPKSGQATGVLLHIESPPVEIGEVKFSGVSPEWSGPMGDIEKAALGQPFNQSIEETLATGVRNVYHRQGYLDVAMTRYAVGAPEVKGGIVAVPVTGVIEQGSQYRLGNLNLSGDVLMTPAEFAKRAKIHAGDVANEDLLRQTLAEVAGPYKAKGYLRATITAEPVFDRTSHLVTYNITVVPGDVYHMRSLEIRNLPEDKKALVLQNWTLRQGEAYDATYPPTFLNRNAKALHALDGWSATYKQYEHEDTHVVDLVISFAPGGPLR